MIEQILLEEITVSK